MTSSHFKSLWLLLLALYQSKDILLERKELLLYAQMKYCSLCWGCKGVEKDVHNHHKWICKSEYRTLSDKSVNNKLKLKRMTPQHPGDLFPLWPSMNSIHQAQCNPFYGVWNAANVHSPSKSLSEILHKGVNLAPVFGNTSRPAETQEIKISMFSDNSAKNTYCSD